MKPDDFVNEVLARTSGGTCRHAEPLLPALVDDELDSDSRALVEEHVAHCEGCRALAAALREAAEVLPSLVEVEPPPFFAESVLAATSRAVAVPSLSRKMAEFWWRILSRPRASLELAYVATVLLVVLLGNPVSAFRGAQQQATQLAGSVQIEQLRQQLPTARAAGVIDRTVAAVVSTASAIEGGASARWAATKGMFNVVAAALRDAIDWIRKIDLKQMLRDIKSVFMPEPNRGDERLQHRK